MTYIDFMTKSMHASGFGAAPVGPWDQRYPQLPGKTKGNPQVSFFAAEMESALSKHPSTLPFPNSQGRGC